MSNKDFIDFIARLAGYTAGVIGLLCQLFAIMIFVGGLNGEPGQKIGLAVLLMVLGILSFLLTRALFLLKRKSRDQ